jgi:hypothetical protein
VIRTRSHLSIESAGKINVQNTACIAHLPSNFSSDLTLRLRFRIAAIPQPVGVAVLVPSVPLDGSTTASIAQWGFGRQ